MCGLARLNRRARIETVITNLPINIDELRLARLNRRARIETDLVYGSDVPLAVSRPA